MLRTMTEKKLSKIEGFRHELNRVFDDDESAYVEDVRDNGMGENPEKILIERETVSGLEGIISQALSEFEMRVLLCHLNGMSYKESAGVLNKDMKSIDNAMQRIKKKLENLV